MSLRKTLHADGHRHILGHKAHKYYW